MNVAWIRRLTAKVVALFLLRPLYPRVGWTRRKPEADPISNGPRRNGLGVVQSPAGGGIHLLRIQWSHDWFDTVLLGNGARDSVGTPQRRIDTP